MFGGTGNPRGGAKTQEERAHRSRMKAGNNWPVLLSLLQEAEREGTEGPQV